MQIFDADIFWELLYDVQKVLNMMQSPTPQPSRLPPPRSLGNAPCEAHRAHAGHLPRADRVLPAGWAVDGEERPLRPGVGGNAVGG